MPKDEELIVEASGNVASLPRTQRESSFGLKLSENRLYLESS